jgi:DNA-binding response OmpR family regulator
MLQQRTVPEHTAQRRSLPVGGGSGRRQTGPPESEKPSLQDGKRPRVLVIEDDEDLRNTIQEMLEAEGFVVRTLTDGTGALVLHRDEPFDLVVTDIFMPNKDGIETISDFRQEFPQTRIIAMSVGSKFRTFNLDLLCRELGVKALTKPFGAEAFLQAVREALPRKRHQ